MTERSIILDVIRWISALIVVSGHVRSMLFVDYNPEVTNYFYKFIYFITGFGEQAVMIFFVLSGYLICNSILKQMSKHQFNLKNYLINRFSRIYIVLIPALFLTLFFDSIGTLIDRKGIYQLNDMITSLDVNPSSRLSLPYFLGSLFMLQRIIIAPYGSNGPLWSLSYEFWYYLIIPSILGMFYLNKKYIIIFANAVLILLFLYFIPINILKYSLIWLLGLIPIFIKKQSKPLQYGSFILLIITLTLSRLYNFEFIIESIIGLSIALFISTFDDHKIEMPQKHIHAKLASFSYTLYIVHYSFSLFLLVAIDRFVFPAIKVAMNPFTLFIYVISISIVYVFSYFFACLTEYKTDRLRKIIYRVI